MVKCEISNISPPCFGAMAVKAMAFWEISLFSHQNLLFFKLAKIRVINLIHHHMVYTLAIITWGIIGVKYTIFYAKCHVNKIYKYGYCPGHMYIGYGMLVQYQIVIFLCLYTNTHSVYIVCHIESYSTLKFTKFRYNFGSSWHIVLVVILSGICHLFWS